MRLIHAVLIPALAALTASAGFTGALAAAEQPLGVVESSDKGTAVLRFDASVKLLPGSMVAIYGPGSVKKHPLTKEILTEERVLVAKAQVIDAIDPAKVKVRLTWIGGIAPAAGFDVVPLPKEAAPNAAPSLTGAVAAVSAPVQGSVKITLPFTDPDGDTVAYSWHVEGAVGQAGVLSSRTGTVPEVWWTAPGNPGTATLVVTARDPLGQETVAKVPLTATADDNWRAREPKSFATLGTGRQSALARVVREPAGTWLGITAAGTVERISTGWLSTAAVAFAQDKGPARPVTALTVGKELHVLDGKRAAVLVYGADGNPLREYGGGSAPSDLAIAPDGTAFIADQDAGGVLVYEANGAFRLRLGRSGKGEDAFTGLSRLALARSGELSCLDVTQAQVQRFDRFHRRLPTWQLQTDAKNPPVDIAVHAKGLLVLLASGQVLVADAKGQTSQAWKGLGDVGLVARAGTASSLTVDAAGEVFVTYPEYGFVARYSADGAFSGVAGASLWTQAHYALDGQGRFIALDADSGMLSVFDQDGFLLGRVGGLVRGGGVIARAGALAVAPDGQSAVVLDTSEMHVVRFDLTDIKVKPLVFAQAGKNNGQLQSPLAVAMDAAGRSYVLDGKQHRVQVFDAAGAFLFSFGRYERGKQPDELSEPIHVAVSPAGDAAYVYDYDTYELKKFALDQTKKEGVHVNNTGGKGDGPAQFRSVVGLAADRLGLLYVLDDSRDDLQVIDFRGSNAVAGAVRKVTDLGLKGGTQLGVSPEGRFVVAYDGALAGWRW
jgi:DNA-binding beta-propeller fold protein YncE